MSIKLYRTATSGHSHRAQLMLSLLLLVLALLVAACSSESMYRTGQANERQRCYRIADATERQRCLDASRPTHDDYKAETGAQKPRD